MNNPDARLLHPIIEDYLRQQAIRLRQKGKRIGEIATYLGVHRTTVSGWWRQYQHEGALKQQPRGAKLSEGRTLNAAEEATVQRLIQDHFPEELNKRLLGEMNRDCALTLKLVAVMHRSDRHQKSDSVRNELMSTTLPALVIKGKSASCSIPKN